MRAQLGADPRLVIDRLETMETIVAQTVAERRMALQLLTTFAVIELALALLGLYGVISFNVSQRTREFGVRSALGAQRRALLTLVIGEGARMALAGMAIGLLAALSLTRVLQRFLFDVSATDPQLFALTCAVLLLCALAACVAPALRAASADPVRTLRAE